jgi:hypothetical protein
MYQDSNSYDRAGIRPDLVFTKVASDAMDDKFSDMFHVSCATQSMSTRKLC